MTVAEPEMPASARRLEALAGWDALIFLHCGLFWVVCAGCLALAIARLALGQVEVPPALLAASWISVIFVLWFTPFAAFVAGARSSRSLYNTTDAKGIAEKLPLPFEYDPVLIGCLISMAFMMLGIDYDLVVGLFRVEGSQRERIGSIARDVGIMGAGATCCFIILPTMILRQWRMK